MQHHRGMKYHENDNSITIYKCKSIYYMHDHMHDAYMHQYIIHIK